MAEHHDFLLQTETTVPIIHPPGGGKVVGVLRDQSTFKVLSEQTGGAYAILEQKIPAGHGPPLHVHRHETEIFYILEGQFEVTIGGQKVSAPAGAIVVGGPTGHSAHFSQCRIGRREAAADRYSRTLCQLFHRSGRCGR
jgi:quercetin dioxygenase-like cupin family protein